MDTHAITPDTPEVVGPPEVLAPHPGGRPTKRTPEVETLILEGIRAGMTYRHAAQRGGIGISTFHEWRHDYPEFADAVKAADNVMIGRALTGINQAGKAGKWQAWAWLLERRFPEDYGRQRIEISGPGGGPIPIVSYDLSHLTIEELRAIDTIQDRLSAAAGNQGGTGEAPPL